FHSRSVDNFSLPNSLPELYICCWPLGMELSGRFGTMMISRSDEVSSAKGSYFGSATKSFFESLLYMSFIL
ncbi:MAG: hypothetical protein ACRECH_03715, partial [Nitrososphaerales archaeon]